MVITYGLLLVLKIRSYSPILSFFIFRNLMQKKNPYYKDSLTRNDRYITIKRITYIIVYIVIV